MCPTNYRYMAPTKLPISLIVHILYQDQIIMIWPYYLVFVKESGETLILHGLVGPKGA